MEWLPYLVAAWLFLVGLYGMTTSRHYVHLTLCLGLVQSSTYVLLMAVGFRTGGTAPVFSDVEPGARVVDPLVQALTLTDVVVAAAVQALLLALALGALQRCGTMDPNDLKAQRG